MKTRKIIEVIVEQGGGCCGPAPKGTIETQSSQVSGTSVIEEKPQTTGGCCG